MLLVEVCVLLVEIFAWYPQSIVPGKLLVKGYHGILLVPCIESSSSGENFRAIFAILDRIGIIVYFVDERPGVIF